VGAGWLRVIADDLTGACDVAAALLPLPGDVVVAGTARWSAPGGAHVVVRNTQSRTLAPERAAARVRHAFDDLPAGWLGVVLKKIDTGLRGPLGAELDAAMDASGADVALVLPAIPDAGRTTVGGRQLADGTPVHETAFARDPDNPVTDACVAAVIASTSRRRTATVDLDEVRSGGAAAALADRRAAGATIVVGDAETDEDLDRWIASVPVPNAAGGRSIVLAGSTGIARALHRRLLVRDGSRRPSLLARPAGCDAAVLVVSGSAHPVAREQLRHAERLGLVRTTELDPGAPERAADALSNALRDGRHAALAVPGEPHDGGRDRVLEAVARTTRAVVERRCPRALVLVGGETAFHVLAALGDPRLRIEGTPAPLAVRATVLDGGIAGLPLVTKGGSTGPPERLASLVAEVAA
jgi:uncharacterized protein YgbK (DUF1537 family)